MNGWNVSRNEEVEKVEWILKLGKDTTYEDYQKMLESHELDDVIPAAQAVVDQFKSKFPTVPVDQVTLVINRDATPGAKLELGGARPAENVQIRIEQRGKVSCFDCEAFGDDEQCWKNRHWVGANGEVGSDCPRIKQATERSK